MSVPLRVECLEGRALLSYLVVPHGNTVVPVHVGDARLNEPLFSNGLAVKKAPHFYNLYTGPRRPELNGVRASGFVSGDNLILSGTVAGPIPVKPSGPAQEARFTFLIDRGGSSKQGPFPGRPRIRFDTAVVAEVLPSGLKGYLRLNDPFTNLPNGTVQSLPSSALSIDGNVVSIAVPLSMLPSTGHAFDQWNVNFMTSNPAQRQSFRSIASFTPEFTEFQIHAKPSLGS